LLIDPINQQVEIDRQGQQKEMINHPQTLSGETVLPEFFLDLEAIEF
jgi:Uma2 family endonuclease